LEPSAPPVSYLASLPKNASSVALLLDPYHLMFDYLFEMVSLSQPNFQAHQSSWQHLCHFGKLEKGKRIRPGKQSPRDTNTSIIPIHLPPGDTSDSNGDETIASEGVNQVTVHVQTTPMASEIILSTMIQPPQKHVHALGCPTYWVNSFLQGGNNQPKWEQQA
jgi:hypothetical protein